MSIKIEDENNVPKYLKMLKELNSKELKIGIFGEDDSEMLMIARVHEYGVDIEVTEKMRNYLHYIGIHLSEDTTEINIPERSFMRDSFDKKQKSMQQQANLLLEKVLDLQIDVDTFYETLGEIIVGMVQEYMTDLSDPPNAPATIEQKGSSNPLIDEGHLKDAITYKVS